MRPVVGLLAVSALFTADAATLTWDADPAAVGAQDGAGAWNIVTTNWWDGTASGLEIGSVGPAGSTITFDVR